MISTFALGFRIHYSRTMKSIFYWGFSSLVHWLEYICLYPISNPNTEVLNWFSDMIASYISDSLPQVHGELSMGTRNLKLQCLENSLHSINICGAIFSKCNRLDYTLIRLFFLQNQCHHFFIKQFTSGSVLNLYVTKIILFILLKGQLGAIKRLKNVLLIKSGIGWFITVNFRSTFIKFPFQRSLGKGEKVGSLPFSW